MRSPPRLRLYALFAGAAAASQLASPARADTTLTVDLATPLHPATRAASGSLYGVTEDVPADVNALVAPLRPNMFTNPAANVQQPHGDAILVAVRVAPTGARVTIRLADWFPGWPYQFSDMADWLDKVGQTVASKQASGVDNYYGYEIWNEPALTWTSSIPFNDFWKQTYDELRRLDPTVAIIGPSEAGYDAGGLRSFLTFARDNDCLPDIIAWHQWGGDPGWAIQDYRSLEQELGIGPLRLSINEYGGAEEGQPGASAPLIAKFERFGVDTACISFWDVAHPGRLGSLLASDTEPNGGWWFYKWYGDMTGNMVDTVPPAPDDVIALDGFANLDEDARFASVALAGVNDGTVRVVFQGFDAVPFFGSMVHAVVEHTPWVDRATVVNATNTVSEVDLPIADGQIEVSIPNASDVDGYRVYLTPLGTGTGGAGGAGTGGSSTGGSSTGGSSTGGSGTGGSSTGGATTGGAITGGIATGGIATAGSTSTGGLVATGGWGGAGGTGGFVPVGGTSGGGTGGTGGTIGSGGALASGGAFAAGGTLTGGSAPLDRGNARDEGGCNCRTAPAPHAPTRGLGLALLVIIAVSTRRRRGATSDATPRGASSVAASVFSVERGGRPLSDRSPPR